MVTSVKKLCQARMIVQVNESPLIYERGKRWRGSKNSKEGNLGLFLLLRQARKTLLLMLEGVATHAASSH